MTMCLSKIQMNWIHEQWSLYRDLLLYSVWFGQSFSINKHLISVCVLYEAIFERTFFCKLLANLHFIENELIKYIGSIPQDTVWVCLLYVIILLLFCLELLKCASASSLSFLGSANTQPLFYLRNCQLYFFQAYNFTLNSSLKKNSSQHNF